VEAKDSVLEHLEPATKIEPVTFSLGRRPWNLI
jgi:hypothetical protein